jgi:hypothetical protein
VGRHVTRVTPFCAASAAFPALSVSRATPKGICALEESRSACVCVDAHPPVKASIPIIRHRIKYLMMVTCSNASDQARLCAVANSPLKALSSTDGRRASSSAAVSLCRGLRASTCVCTSAIRFCHSRGGSQNR